MSRFVATVCDLCNVTGVPLRQGLVAWKHATPRYEHVTRCTDEAACRERVMRAGDEWPIYERGERTVEVEA